MPEIIQSQKANHREDLEKLVVGEVVSVDFGWYGIFSIIFEGKTDDNSETGMLKFEDENIVTYDEKTEAYETKRRMLEALN